MRNAILALLTDSEVAIVSRANERQLIQGDEYIDLANLPSGIRTASARVNEADSVVARRDVSDATWDKVVHAMRVFTGSHASGGTGNAHG